MANPFITYDVDPIISNPGFAEHVLLFIISIYYFEVYAFHYLIKKNPIISNISGFDTLRRLVVFHLSGSPWQGARLPDPKGGRNGRSSHDQGR